jgi:hypothetical protein
MGILIFVPGVCIYGMHNALGGKIKDLKIGIVNDEISHFSDCRNMSMTQPILTNSSCRLNKASCGFIDEFDAEVAQKVWR